MAAAGSIRAPDLVDHNRHRVAVQHTLCRTGTCAAALLRSNGREERDGMGPTRRDGAYNQPMIPDIHTYARKGLETELARLDAERERVKTLLASLDGAPTRTAGAPLAKRPRRMSEAGRQAIREAVKRRWAKARATAAAASSDGSAAAGDSAKQAAGKPAQRRSQGRPRAKAVRGNRKK
jgi:hypothetical protein